MLLGRCILSILLFPFIFIVYLVYDLIINKYINKAALRQAGCASKLVYVMFAATLSIGTCGLRVGTCVWPYQHRW